MSFSNKIKLILCFFIFNISVIVAQTSFEGVLEVATYTLENNDEALVKWYAKNGHNRMEVKGTAGGNSYSTTLLFRKNETQMNLLTEIGGQKAIYTVPQSSLEQAIPTAGTRVSETSESKKIAGYDARLYKIETIEGLAECWVSFDAKISSLAFPPALQSKGIMGILTANGIKGLPLEVINRDAMDEIVYSFAVKNISTQTVSESLFETPAGYQSGEELLQKSFKVE